MKDRSDKNTNRSDSISERRVLGSLESVEDSGSGRNCGNADNERPRPLVAECVSAYRAKFGDRMFILDSFVAYLLLSALLLVSYAVATGAFEFVKTSVFAAVGSCVGTATLAACLRTQVSPLTMRTCQRGYESLVGFLVEVSHHPSFGRFRWTPCRSEPSKSNPRLDVCVQVLNFKEFKVTECRAVQEFMLCFVVLQVAVFLLID